MNRLNLLLISLSLCLTACGSIPERPEQEPIPELNLNLPQPDCVCQPEETADFTFLEKGFTALHDAEYLESLQYFQRYQRMEKNPVANMEARIAITYLSMLPDSPIFDGAAVGKSYGKIQRDLRPEWKLHERIRQMQDSLESFLDMQAQLGELERANTELRRQLQRREEAITRLRDLTLGRDPD